MLHSMPDHLAQAPPTLAIRSVSSDQRPSVLQRYSTPIDWQIWSRAGCCRSDAEKTGRRDLLIPPVQRVPVDPLLAIGTTTTAAQIYTAVVTSLEFSG